MKYEVTHHASLEHHTMRVGNAERQRSHDIGLIWHHHHRSYTFREKHLKLMIPCDTIIYRSVTFQPNMKLDKA